MRICIVGNSHVAAWRSASLACPGIEFDFYAIPGGGGPSLRRAGDRFFPLNPKALVKSSIDGVESAGLRVDGYDALVLAGVGLTAAKTSQNNLHLELAVAGFLPPDADIGTRQVVSQAVFERTLSASLSRMACMAALLNLARAFPRPLFVQITPLPTANVVQRSDYSLPYGEHSGRFFAWLHGVQSRAVQAACARHANVTVLASPEPQWLAQGFTPVAFQSGGDPWHMNGSYGDLLIRQVVDAATRTG